MPWIQPIQRKGGRRPSLLAAGKSEPVLDLQPEIFLLLRDWTFALIRLQHVEPAKPERDGAFRCPACNHLHGPAGDAVYPLLAMAKRTGESRYLAAVKRAAAWMRNVADYLITYLSEDYQTTIIGVPGRKYAWIMARTKTLPDVTYQQLIAELERRGHDLSKLRKVPQR